MEVKRTRKQIIVDTGVKQHKLTLSDFKKEFGENDLKLYFVNWEISGSNVIFTGDVPGVIKGISIRRIVFDAEKGAFTGERIGIHLKKSESALLMAEVEVYGQKHKLFWDDVRKLFNIKKFKAKSICFETINSVFRFDVWNLTHSYSFAFTPTTEKLSDSKVVEIEAILKAPKKEKKRTPLDFRKTGIFLRG